MPRAVGAAMLSTIAQRDAASLRHLDHRPEFPRIRLKADRDTASSLSSAASSASIAPPSPPSSVTSSETSGKDRQAWAGARQLRKPTTRTRCAFSSIAQAGRYLRGQFVVVSAVAILAAVAFSDSAKIVSVPISDTSASAFAA